MDNKVQVTRRAMAGAGGMMLAAAAAVAPGSSAASAQEMDTKMDDPRTIYPQPPFPSQSQPFPGLVDRMDPRPVHGEEATEAPGGLPGAGR
ncbi:hypothetical protein [Neorhizobium turbinariae]|uniref:hypothetical protein n=1 Tax=Neorhizobium turbinariae TaxID=2937795 RepID=UPI0028BF2E0B|nr:hypothetical protein [Neorhizobium turbinariae]